MGEYAPDALIDLGEDIAATLPGGEPSGVVGDPAHTYGYHRARNLLPDDDYSVQLERDEHGDGWAASAVDVSFPPASQHLATRRLLDAANAHDKRLYALREFFGSLDSTHVRGYDLAFDEDSNNADNSHLWHIHLSIFRKYANDRDAVQGILDVITGEPDDMPKMVSVDNSQPQNLGEDWTTLRFDTEYADPDDDHADDGGVTFLRGHNYFSATVSAYIDDLPPDTTVKMRLVEAEKKGDDYPVQKTYPAAEFIATSGITNLQFSQVGSLNAGHRLRAQVRLYPPVPGAMISNNRVKCLYWDR